MAYRALPFVDARFAGEVGGLSSRRLLCALPDCLAKYCTPKMPNDLTRQQCIGIRLDEEAYGVWRLASSRDQSLVCWVCMRSNSKR